MLAKTKKNSIKTKTKKNSIKSKTKTKTKKNTIKKKKNTIKSIQHVIFDNHVKVNSHENTVLHL